MSSYRRFRCRHRRFGPPRRCEQGPNGPGTRRSKMPIRSAALLVVDMQVGFDKPDAWFALQAEERGARVAFTPDVAVIDNAHHFVRGVLEIPVHGEPQPFGWGIWVKVSRADFASFTGEGDASNRDPFPGRIASQLAGYPQTLGQLVNVRPSGDALRPLFDAIDAVHPLSGEEREGTS